MSVSLTAAVSRRSQVVFVFALLVALGLPAGASAGHRSHRSARAASTRISAPQVRRLRRARRFQTHLKLGHELVALRTQSSKTYAARNGDRVTRFFSEPVHYRAGKRGWRPIDVRLRKSGRRLLNRSNNFSTSLPLDLGRDTVR